MAQSQQNIFLRYFFKLGLTQPLPIQVGQTIVPTYVVGQDDDHIIGDVTQTFAEIAAPADGATLLQTGLIPAGGKGIYDVRLWLGAQGEANAGLILVNPLTPVGGSQFAIPVVVGSGGSIDLHFQIRLEVGSNIIVAKRGAATALSIYFGGMLWRQLTVS